MSDNIWGQSMSENRIRIAFVDVRNDGEVLSRVESYSVPRANDVVLVNNRIYFVDSVTWRVNDFGSGGIMSVDVHLNHRGMHE